VEQVPSRHRVRHTIPLGTRYTTAASASVQVFLAQLGALEVRSLLMNGSIEHPGLDEAALEAYLVRLHQVAERGYAVNYGETSPAEVGVAAPVTDHRGAPVAAVLVSAPRFRISTQQASAIGDAVQEAADDISTRLGGQARRQR
jgi:DNA-binding IclR family transcriptional regulator